MPEELRTIKELGETQKHKKKNCNEFGKIVKLKASKSGVKLMYLCENCNDNFIETYNNEEFVNMANGFLIDDEWVRDFQRKHMIVAQEFVPLKNGLDGAHFAEKSKVVKNWGEKFICECNDFYKMEFKGYKKQNLNFKLSCSDCSPKGKKLVIPTEKFFELGQAGVLPHDIVNNVREELIADEYKFDTGEGYYTPSTILSEKAKDVLEMGDHYAMKKCPKCKAFVDAEAPLCTECGHEF